MENDNTLVPVYDTSLVPVQPAETNISKVEEQLVGYYEEITKSTESDIEFNEYMKEELKMKFSEMSAKEMMNFYTNYNVNLNDKISKSLAPVSNLLTAKQQAEIAEQSRRERNVSSATQINIQTGASAADYEKKNTEASAEVIQGLNMIYQMVESFKKAENSEQPPQS